MPDYPPGTIIAKNVCNLPLVEGVKFDNAKPRFDLIPPVALLEVARVLQHGASKYAPDNWKKLDNLRGRYLGAAGRHINAYMRGEEVDLESITHHLACAITSLMFVLEKDLNPKL